MPLDATGYLSPRVLTEDEVDDLAVLKAARHLIRHRWRWWRGHGKMSFPPTYCALTAVAAAEVRLKIKARGARMVQRLDDNLPPCWSSVMAFNDHSTTTHADVLALFDRAIAEIESIT
jgi:hypothetical protein